MYRPTEWTSDRNRPAIKPLGFTVTALAKATPRSALQNASTTADLPSTTQAQMPNGRLTSQAADQGIIATIEAVAHSPYECSLRIFHPPIISTPDRARIGTPKRAPITNPMVGIS